MSIYEIKNFAQEVINATEYVCDQHCRYTKDCTAEELEVKCDRCILNEISDKAYKIITREE